MLRRQHRVVRCISVVVLAVLAAWPSSGNAQTAIEVVPKLDTSRIVPGTATFELRYDERHVFGNWTVVIERSADGFVVRETVASINGDAITEVRIGADLRMKSIRHRSEAEDHSRVDVVYADGRASGTVSGRWRSTLKVDVRVPPDVIDDHVLMALFPAMPWAEGAEWTLPVFDPDPGELLDKRFRVGPVETISTTLGTYRTYPVEVTRPYQTLVFYVAAEPPHGVIKMKAPGSSLELVRTSPLWKD